MVNQNVKLNSNHLFLTLKKKFYILKCARIISKPSSGTFNCNYWSVWLKRTKRDGMFWLQRWQWYREICGQTCSVEVCVYARHRSDQGLSIRELFEKGIRVCDCFDKVTRQHRAWAPGKFWWIYWLLMQWLGLIFWLSLHAQRWSNSR